MTSARFEHALGESIQSLLKQFREVKHYRTRVLGGPDCEIKPGVFFDYEGVVILGKEVVIADGVRIRTHAHPAMRYRADWRGVPTTPHVLVIDNNVFVGDAAMITPGCKYIAEGVIIGMGAVVTKDINEPYTIWGGNPAKQIGVRE